MNDKDCQKILDKIIQEGCCSASSWQVQVLCDRESYGEILYLNLTTRYNWFQFRWLLQRGCPDVAIEVILRKMVSGIKKKYLGARRGIPKLDPQSPIHQFLFFEEDLLFFSRKMWERIKKRKADPPYRCFPGRRSSLRYYDGMLPYEEGK